MIILPPLTITDAILTACNVTEDDYTAWSGATAYVVGNYCIRATTHKIYQCLVNNTNNIPENNLTGATPKWLEIGATNRWKMFDAKVGSQTEKAETITLTLAPAQVFDSIAFLDIDATEIIITMTDPVEGVVYTETIDLVNNGLVVDGYTYFFEPIILTDATVLLGIPPYINATIDITINNPSGTAKIGTLAIGRQSYLGATQYDPTIGITDYSKKQADAFGNYSVLVRAYSKKMSCELEVENTAVDALQRVLASYRATPVIWIGAASSSALIVYGFYKSFSIVIPHPTQSRCSLEIEGLT